MGVIQTSRVWTTEQPKTLIKANAIAAINFGSDGLNVGNRGALTNTGLVSNVIFAGEIFSSQTISAHGTYIGGLGLSATTPRTLILRLLTSATGTVAVGCNGISSATQDFSCPGIYTSGSTLIGTTRLGSGAYADISGPIVSANQLVTIAITWVPGVGSYMAVDGSFIGSAVSAETSLYRSFNTLFVGYATGQRFGFAAALDYAVTSNELVSLSANPWQLFKPRTTLLPGKAGGLALPKRNI